MVMKLRQIPEDFVVEEINDFNLFEEGKFKVYSLEKKGIETFFLISHLSKLNDIPSSNFGIAGLKDKHAITKQFFSIPSKYDLKTLTEPNFSIKLAGYMDRPIVIGRLFGNRFAITVRDLRKEDLEKIKNRANELQYGVPNYFDSQRFGSVINGEFIAKYLVKKDYEKAVKLFLTGYTKHESKKIKDDKRKILDSWNNLENVELSSRTLAKVVDEYKAAKDFSAAYKKIDQNIRQMIISAYQSYLWNECVKETLKKCVKHKVLYNVKYNIGDLLYYKDLNNDEEKRIPHYFKLISHDAEFNDFEKKIVDGVLKKEGLSLPDFDIKSATSNFFKAQNRHVLILPEDFELSEPSIDELNDKGRRNVYKVTLSFSLQKGSYATIVTKKIFGR